LLTPAADPVHKVTIIPRGMALGVTMTMPDEDRFNLTKDQMVAQIKHAMGGRAAEKLVLNYISTGASNDLKQATEMARNMVCLYGMNDRIGPVSFGDGDHDVFLGRDFMSRSSYSADTARMIDEEVTAMLTSLYDEAYQMLADNRPMLDRIAGALLERETLDRGELDLLMRGERLPDLPLPIAERPAVAAAGAARPKGFAGEAIPDPEPVPG
jgi:cell division protease FtsH